MLFAIGCWILGYVIWMLDVEYAIMATGIWNSYRNFGIEI